KAADAADADVLVVAAVRNGRWRARIWERSGHGEKSAPGDFEAVAAWAETAARRAADRANDARTASVRSSFRLDAQGGLTTAFETRSVSGAGNAGFLTSFGGVG